MRTVTARATADSVTGSRWGAVAICVLLNMLDGLDVLVMAFTAPAVSAAWKLSGSELGVLLSSGLVGMAAGAPVLAPFADRFGRRPVIVFSLCLMTIGTLGSGLAPGTGVMTSLRILTGLGVGGILATVSVILTELIPVRSRGASISLMTMGYPLGATVGGILIAELLKAHSWRSGFIFAGSLSFVMVFVTLWCLPESAEFALGTPTASLPQRLPNRSVRYNTLMIRSAFFLAMSAYYFAVSWIPKLLAISGYANQQGITAGVLLNLGGIAGCLLFGVLLAFARLQWLTSCFLVTSSLSLLALGMSAPCSRCTFSIAVVLGAASTGALAGLYAVAPTLFPLPVRSTGVGWSIGVGRIGAIVAPMSVGMLIDRGWQAADFYLFFALPMLGAGLAVRAMRTT